MARKEILRKVLAVFCWADLLFVTVEFALGKIDTFSTVCMFVCYFIWATILINKIRKEAIKYKAYRQYQEGFTYLKAIHKTRYKLYFTGTSKEVEIYSEEIERYGNILLNLGEWYISNNIFGKTRTEKVQEILEKTKELMITVNKIEGL